ncbi:hypothetical protein IJ425_05310 [bacterium]|nr:hypothetical protein [bacterium]
MLVNSSSIPFTSTYKFNYEANDGPRSYNNQSKVDDFAYRNHLTYELNYNTCECGLCDTIAVGTIIAPDYKDSQVEKFCKANAIPFEKISYVSLIGEDAIINRCVLPEHEEDDKIMVMLDVEKFEDLAASSEFGNIQHCKEMYKQHFSKDAHNMILSGDEIEVPTLYVNAPYGRMSASLIFNQTSDKPNHCLYFAMKNIGMTKVPVAVNQESYEAGMELGLFE